MSASYLIHPQENFLQTIAKLLAQEENLAHLQIILPSRRSGLFLRYYLAQEIAKPFIPPQIYSLEDFVFLKFIQIHPYSLINYLEFIHLTYPYFQNFLSLENYLEWSNSFYELLEETDKELIDIPNIHLSLQANTCTEYILTHLKEIKEDLERKFHQHRLTTPGFCFRTLANNLQVLDSDLQTWLVGFFALTQSERVIFSYLKDQGARFFFEDDPKEIHPILVRELKKLKLTPQTLSKKDYPEPKFSFVFASTYHALIKEIKHHLAENPSQPDKIALLTTVNDTLKPLMFELKDKKVNFALGYPLKYSVIFSFLQIIKNLMEHRQEEYIYLPSFLDFIKHPFIKNNKLKGRLLEEDIFQLDLRLKEQGKAYLTLEEIKKVKIHNPDLKEALDFILSLFQNYLNYQPAEKTTVKNLVKTFQELFKALHLTQQATSLELEEPTGLKSLLVWQEQVLSQLKLSPLQEQSLSWKKGLHLILNLTQKIFLPLKGEPLAGIQVLGLLESRLLAFNKVLVLGAEEGNLPQSSSPNPLLSGEIRLLLNLPQQEKQEQIQGYHLTRLLKASKEVYFLLTTSEKKDFLGGKNIPSRFVEKIIWELEKQKKEPAFKQLSTPLSSSALNTKTSLPKTKEHKEKIKTLLLQGISPSHLNTYLKCELLFYFNYILQLKEERKLGTFDSALLGSVVHKTLEVFFRPFKGKKICIEDKYIENLREILDENFRQMGLLEKLDKDKKLFLRHITYHKLKKYIQTISNTYSGYEVEELEKKVEYKLTNNIYLKGKIDKIIKNANQLIVLDYKTGQQLTSTAKIREVITKYTDLTSLKEKKFDFQIPFYIFLLTETQDKDINGGWVYLAPYEPKITLLFTEKNLKEEQELLNQNLPLLLKLVCTDMLEKDYFEPSLSQEPCSFCAYRKICPSPVI